MAYGSRSTSFTFQFLATPSNTFDDNRGSMCPSRDAESACAKPVVSDPYGRLNRFGSTTSFHSLPYPSYAISYRFAGSVRRISALYHPPRHSTETCSPTRNSFACGMAVAAARSGTARATKRANTATSRTAITLPVSTHPIRIRLFTAALCLSMGRMRVGSTSSSHSAPHCS